MKYLVNLIIWGFLNDLQPQIIALVYNCDLVLISILFVFLGEILFGLIAYLYLRKYINKKNPTKISTFMSIHLIANRKIKTYDSKYRIYFLIIIAAFFDFAQYLFYIGLTPELNFCSKSLEKRIRGLIIIIDSLFYQHILKFQIFKHQRFSLLVILICLILTIGIEFIFQDFNIFMYCGNFALLLLKLFIYIFFNCLVDLVEKYLLEYDYVNPLEILLFEGIIGLFLGILYGIYINPIPSAKKCHKKYQEKFWYVFMFFFLIMILSGIKNTLRVITNKVYTPMAIALSEYFLNPIYIILTLTLANDFKSERGSKYLFFALNLILTIIISLSGCVYNEFIILFFCGLQHETYEVISSRADDLDNNVLELNNTIERDEEESSVKSDVILS